ESTNRTGPNYFSVLAGPVLRNVLSLVEACRSSGISILFTRHGHRDPVRDGGMLEMYQLTACG
ncbi:MAG: hypothetical protein KAU38_08400, partial [Desulfobacterales bacterium]|nr:hypothetical protein [Desulfobacterales bacterium]